MDERARTRKAVFLLTIKAALKTFQGYFFESFRSACQFVQRSFAYQLDIFATYVSFLVFFNTLFHLICAFERAFLGNAARQFHFTLICKLLKSIFGFKEQTAITTGRRPLVQMVSNLWRTFPGHLPLQHPKIKEIKKCRSDPPVLP